ncbi:MAG: FlgO family outer membrane protein [Vicinamibacterales bacterium]
MFRRSTAACVVAVLGVSTSVVPVVVEAQEATSGDTRRLASEQGSIAVGPFVNISGRLSDDWIGYGIAETVSADLQQWTTLSVVGRDVLGEEFSQAAVRPDDLGRVARELSQTLGARWLIIGGYQRINDQVRITARVLETKTGRIETVTRVDGNIAELFTLQDQIVVKLGEGFRALTNAPMVAAGAVPPTPTPTDVAGGLSLDTSGAAGFGVAEGAGILTGRPTLRPGRSDVRPDIDGRLDDVIWQDAIHITEFVQQNPVEGAPPTEDTDVWIAYDSQNLYIAVHAHYSDPSIMRANRVDRDQSFDDDNISFYFDTFLDQQRAYLFSVNGYGVQGDAIVNARGFGRSNRRRSTGSFSAFRGGIPTGDNSWDALFSSGGQQVDDGYTAEIAIPFKSLRYPEREQGLPHRWGFQIVREIRGKDEFQVWAPVTRNVSGFLTQAGLLEGMTNLSLSRNLEIMPTFTGVQYGSLNQQGKFVDGDPSPEGGVNVKYGITSNLIADFTYNPDFSQIESDLPQIEVNQRFALFYPELRPFFLEGAEIFSPQRGMVTFVNTRTIVDPEFGGKITGKVGNTTVGLMIANDEAPGRTDSSTDSAFGEKANNIVGRARYDLYAESYVGALVTHREFLDTHSTLGALDGNFRLGQTQSLSFQAVQTDHRDLEQIDREGQMFNLSWRLTDRHWTSFVSLYTLSPNFRTDVGFVRRVDQKQGFSSLGYTFRPESWVVSWGPSVRYNWNHDFNNVLQDLDKRVAFDATFARNISVNSQFQDEMERFGGINFQKQAGRIGGQISTSRRVSVGGYYEYGDLVRYVENPYLGRGSTGSFFAALRPLSRFQSEINLRTSDFIDPRTGDELVFDVKILRALSTYQFTDRFLLRNISEYNTFDKTVDLNVLFTYRLNAGTAFYIGYDDHYRQADQIYGDDMDGDGIDDQLFPMATVYQQTNRAVFTKFQYLFRF